MTGRHESGADATPPTDLAPDVARTDSEARANDAAERMRPSRRVSAARWGLRLAAGASAAALVAAAVVSAGALPPEVALNNTAREISLLPDAPNRLRACAGDALQLGTADGVNALAVRTLQQPTVAGGREAGAGDETSIETHQIFERQSEGAPVSVAQSLTLPVEGGEGEEQSGVEAPRGFAASECAEASLDQWLVGGSTQTGRQSVVTIVNPGRVSSSVNVTVFGSDGEVESAASSGVTVEPGGVEVVDLAAIAPSVSDPVVRVAAIGAPVTANLQQTTMRGIEAGGFDIVDPMPALSSAYIAGLQIDEPTGVAVTDDFDDAAPVLRLLSPAGGAVGIDIRTDQGEVTTIDATLEPGVVADLALDEVQPGMVSVRVRADNPVVVGARALSRNQALDFDWIAGGQPSSGLVRLAVPPGPSPSLVIANAAEAERQVWIDGEPVDIPASGGMLREIDEGVVDVEGDDIVIAVRYAGDDVVGSYTVSPDGPAASGLQVVR